MAHLLGVHELHCEFPNRVIFNSVTIGMNDGDRIGVVGRNGDGKSTLLSLMSGRLSPTAGRVTSRSGLNIGVLSQTDVLDSHLSVRHTIVGDVADHEWAANPRIRNIVDGLVSDIDWDKNVHELSGGQKRRVALAAVLVEDHDCIFLDEPTNHLDIIGVKWLAEHLKNRWSAGSGGLMVITHDRWFLDEVCATTWEVHDQTIDAFDGGYAAYILQRAERDRQATLSESKRQNLLRKELAWLRRGAPARTSKPKFRIEAANQIIANEPPPRDTVSLTRMAMTRLGKEVVDLQNVSMAFNDVSVLIRH